jgi:dTDP-4-dehydrorhamnose reductase
MKNALIGFSGFIGLNLKKKLKNNCDYYNSKNIQNIQGKNYNKIYCCGNDSRIWNVNQHPFEDLINITFLAKNLLNVGCKKFILISTIEIYNKKKTLERYDENTDPSLKKKLNYGSNRLFFEKFIKYKFKNILILRLPIVYGEKMKKNLIYDIIKNNNNININPNDILQYYPVSFLFKDINIALQKNLNNINLSSAPLPTKTLLNYFKIYLNAAKRKKNVRKYNMTSIHANIFNRKDYRFSKKEIFSDIVKFIIKKK